MDIVTQPDEDHSEGVLPRYTVFLVEDEYPVIQATKAALSGHAMLEFLGHVSNRNHVEEFIAAHAPDLVVVDLQLPIPGSAKSPPGIPEYDLEEGLWIVALVRQISPQSRVVAFSNFFVNNPALALRAFESGATAVLPKQNAPSDSNWGQWFCHQLLAVANGFWIADAVTARLMEEGERRRQRNRSGSSEPGSLTERELEVLRLVAAGLNPKQIALKLSIVAPTVRSHFRNIIGKTHARSIEEAARLLDSRDDMPPISSA